MVGALSFSQHYLCLLPTLQSPPQNSSSSSVKFSPPYFTLTYPQNQADNPHFLPLYLSYFSPTSFCVQPSQQLTSKIFFLPQTFWQFRLRQETRELGSTVRTDTVVISPIFFKVWAVITRTTHNHWFSIAQTQKIGALQVRQTIQSTFSQILNLLSLLPYPTNTITRTQISLETSCLTWFSSYV